VDSVWRDRSTTGDAKCDDYIAFPLESHPLNALFGPIPVGIKR
jgi:hypothetical protein